jgi:hypothetical protein
MKQDQERPMTTNATIYVSEKLGASDGLRPPFAGPPGSLVIVRPEAPTQRLLARDALTHLSVLRRSDDRFDVAVLACDSRADWPAMHTRALIARALLALLAPGGRFLLEAPHGFAHRPLLLALLEALAQLAPRGDVSFGIEFEPSPLDSSAPFIGRPRRTPAGPNVS